MILLDTSAIVCAIIDEPERPRLMERLATESLVIVSAPALLELGIVLASRGLKPRPLIQSFLESVPIEVADFTSVHATLAVDAYVRFGRGSGHPARLNFGDCTTYAVAKASGFELAYKGDDFGRTDLLRLFRLDAPLQ